MWKVEWKILGEQLFIYSKLITSAGCKSLLPLQVEYIGKKCTKRKCEKIKSNNIIYNKKNNNICKNKWQINGTKSGTKYLV